MTPQSRSTEGSFRSIIWGLLKPYLQALESQGAGIVILPPQEDDRLPAILHKLDGVLLPGGVDLDPAHFGEEPLPQMGEVSPERDTMELFVARYTAQHGIPTLGVCRGIQVMNVALGGSLYQDLATQGFSTIQHSQKAEPPVLGHSVEQTGISPLNTLFEPRFRVNSIITRPSRTWPQGATHCLGDGWHCRSGSTGGPPILRGESLTRFRQSPNLLGVQWHPELLPQQWGIFGALLEAAKQPVRSAAW